MSFKAPERSGAFLFNIPAKGLDNSSLAIICYIAAGLKTKYIFAAQYDAFGDH
jgi:hypothetical protein